MRKTFLLSLSFEVIIMIVRLPFVILPDWVDDVRVFREEDTVFITTSETGRLNCGSFIIRGGSVRVYNPRYCVFRRYYYFDKVIIVKDTSVEHSESDVFNFKRPPVFSSLVVKKDSEKRIIWIRPAESVTGLVPADLLYFWDKINVKIDGNLRALIEDSLEENGVTLEDDFKLRDFTSAWIYNKGNKPYLKLFKGFEDVMTIPLANHFTVSPLKPVIINIKPL